MCEHADPKGFWRALFLFRGKKKLPLPAGVFGLNEARPSGALPAGGNWDPEPDEFFVSGASWLGVHVTYQEDAQAVNGAIDVQLELSPYALAANCPAGAEEWITQTLYAPGVVAPGVDSQSRTQAEYVTFDPVTANREAITFSPVELRGIFERARIRARESGDVAAPGVAQMTATLYNGEMFGVQ